MKNINKKWLVIWLLVGGFFALFLSGFATGFLGMIETLTLASKRYILFLVICALSALVWFYGLAAFLRGKDPLNLYRHLMAVLQKTPAWIRWALAILISIFPTYILLFNKFGLMEFGYTFRLGLIIIAGFVATLLVFLPYRTSPWLVYAAAWICASGAFFAMGGWLNRVTGYPFSLSWSEGNRLWDYSIMFASNRYITLSDKPIFAFISAGRQFIWALAYLIPNIGIFGVRLWDAILWILPTFLVGFLAVAGVKKGKRGWLISVLFGLWSFSFLSQGPIYAPIVISAILVVIAMRSRSLAISIPLILLAAFYADFSRWTWRYAPGLWAGMLALLDIVQPGFKEGKWKQLIRPVVLGITGYIGGQYLSDFITWAQSGFTQKIAVSAVVNPTGTLTRQPLLWDRLLPNTTYAPGILLGILWAGLILMILLIMLQTKKYWKINWLQSIAIIAVAGIFLVIGIVISTKIGGGSNLHNLDMFWITLALATGWAFRSLLKEGFTIQGKPWMVTAIFCLALVSPATYLAQYGEPLVLPEKDLVDESLQVIQKRIAKVDPSKEILFIDQRQLLTFGYIKDVPLVSDYEKKYLMDQAMADNATYFKGFIDDLANQRFALIVTEPIHEIYFSDSERTFAQENNSWVKWVSAPLLCYYREAELLPWVGVQILVPRSPEEMPDTCYLP
jgi:hypothetical protein